MEGQNSSSISKLVNDHGGTFLIVRLSYTPTGLSFSEVDCTNIRSRLHERPKVLGTATGLWSAPGGGARRNAGCGSRRLLTWNLAEH
jgi:hypothetical protein